MFGLTAIPSKVAAIVSGLLVIGVLLNATYQNHVSVLEENVRLKALLKTCTARTRDILEDKESDASVRDPATYPVPDHWMLEF